MIVYSVFFELDDGEMWLGGTWLERWAAEAHARTSALDMRRKVVSWHMLDDETVLTIEGEEGEGGEEDDTRYQTHAGHALWHLTEAVRELGNARETARGAGIALGHWGPVAAALLGPLADLAAFVPQAWRDAARKERKR